MKTVMDAVNEFKGEFPYHEPSIVQQLSTGNLDCWHEEDDDDLNTGNFRMVCTKKEFNDLVSQLETNFGESETIGKYSMRTFHEESLLKSLPEQPVFTQAMADNGEFPLVGMEFLMKNKGANESWAQPDFHPAKMKAIGDELFIIESLPVCNGHKESVGTIDDYLFKPIDTRTDKEKAIDEAYKELILASGQARFKDVLNDIYVKWVGE